MNFPPNPNVPPVNIMPPQSVNVPSFYNPLGLPLAILALFQARNPIEFIPPIQKRKLPTLSGVAQYVGLFENPDEAPKREYIPPETTEQRKLRKRREKQKKHDEELADSLKKWDPHTDENIQSNPYKTLFVARINYQTTEQKLRREFEVFGPIKRIRMVTNQNGKPRGYAFIEFENEHDMKDAFKYGDGKKIDNRRVLVDVERGRTVRNWRPKRLGGGLGATRAGGDDVNQKYSGRAPPQSHSPPRSRFEDDRKHRDRGDRDMRDRGDRDRDHRDRDRGGERRDDDRRREKRQRDDGDSSDRRRKREREM